MSDARVETAGPARTPATARAVGRWPRRRWRRWLVWVLRLRGTPHAIAGGLAVGTVITFLPLIGFQTLLALGLSTVLGVSRPASIVPTWLTNPVTIPPVYAFTYWVGSFVWAGPSVGQVVRALEQATHQLARSDWFALRAQLGALLELGGDVFGPMVLGGVFVGGICAALVYGSSLRVVVAVRERRARRRQARRSRSAG